MNKQLSAYRPKSNWIIGVESLNRMFAQRKNPTTITYRDTCHICGSLTKIEISKTSGGYGLLGGIVYEPEPDTVFVLCVGCHEKYGKRDRRADK